MNWFETMAREGHEQLIFCFDRVTGLKAMIGLHDTTLGPALGGCRMWPYPGEQEATLDVLRLAKGMTYKAAASGQDYGGGKCVIWADPGTEKTEGLFRSLGQFVASLGGRFITGPDAGTRSEDFVPAARETRWLVALPEAYGGSGDTGPVTAFGVWRGIKACAREGWGSDSLAGRSVAVQGVGKVGAHLARYLVEDGARVVVTDIDPARSAAVARELGVEVVPPDDIYDQAVDIFSPCALGAVLNDDTVPRLKCRAVAGAANNQLAEERHGDQLHELGILYAPDFIVNAGGLIQVVDELQGFDRERAFRKVSRIYDLLGEVFRIARRDGVPTYRAANTLAEERIATLAAIRGPYVPGAARDGARFPPAAGRPAGR